MPPKKGTKRPHESNLSPSNKTNAAIATTSTNTSIEEPASEVKENKHPVTGELSPSKRPRVGLRQPSEISTTPRRLNLVGDFKRASSLPRQSVAQDNANNSNPISSTSTTTQQPTAAPNLNSSAISSTSILQPSALPSVNISSNAVNSSLHAAVRPVLASAQQQNNDYLFVTAIRFDVQSGQLAKTLATQRPHDFPKVAIKHNAGIGACPFQLLREGEYAPFGSKLIDYLCEKHNKLFGVSLAKIDGNTNADNIRDIKNKMPTWYQRNTEIKARVGNTMEYIYVIDVTGCKLTDEELLIAIGGELHNKVKKTDPSKANVSVADVQQHCIDMPRFHFIRNGTLSSLYHSLTAFSRFHNKNSIKQTTLDQFRQSASATLASTPAVQADNSLRRSSTAVTTTSSNNATTSTNPNLKRSSSAIASTSNTATTGISRYLTAKPKDNDDDDVQITSMHHTTTTSTNNADSAKKSRTTSATVLNRSSSTKTLLEHFAPQTDVQKEENNMKAFQEKCKRYITELTKAEFWKSSNAFNSNPELIPIAKNDLEAIRKNFTHLITEIESSSTPNFLEEKTNLLAKCNNVIENLNQLENQFNNIQLKYNQQKNEIFNTLGIPENSILANFLINEYRKNSNVAEQQNDPFIQYVNSLTDKQLLENIMQAKKQTELNNSEFDTNFLITYLHSIMPQHPLAVFVTS